MPPHTLYTPPPPDTQHMSLRSKTSSKNMARGHWDASNMDPLSVGGGGGEDRRSMYLITTAFETKRNLRVSWELNLFVNANLKLNSFHLCPPA